MTTRRPSRRDFLRVAGLAGLVAGSGRPQAPQPAATVGRPNIVLVLADDLGYADLSCYGQKRFRTPALDRLASEGVRSLDHHAGSPVCAPSRCALLTGLHTGHADIRDNDEMPELGDVWNDPSIEGQRPLPEGTATIGSILKAAGYATAAIGKWGLGGPGSTGEPNKLGFDQFFGYLCQRQAHNYYPTHLWRNRQKAVLDNPSFKAHQTLPADAVPGDPASYARYQGRQYSFDLMVDEALGYIRGHRDGPFFLYFAPTIPHLSLQVPADSLVQYENAFPETPYDGRKGYLPHPKPRAAYAAMISRLDSGVGRMMALLKELGLDERTLVVFTSDNGATFDVGGFDPAFFRSNAPFRGAKQSLYEGGIRVPLVARWPGRIPPGTVDRFASASWDLLPTLLDAASVAPPGRTDGTSLLPALTGAVLQAPPKAEREFLYWEFQGRQAVRYLQWKAIRDARTDALELYDLEADPAETRDLARERLTIVGKVRELMTRARTESARYPLVPRKR